MPTKPYLPELANALPGTVAPRTAPSDFTGKLSPVAAVSSLNH